ncbi:MAG: hypothetical protein Q8P67_20645, partial [archaeon]|nr:hypothetical protein [archaeon]
MSQPPINSFSPPAAASPSKQEAPFFDLICGPAAKPQKPRPISFFVVATAPLSDHHPTSSSPTPPIQQLQQPSQQLVDLTESPPASPPRNSANESTPSSAHLKTTGDANSVINSSSSSSSSSSTSSTSTST